MSQPCPDPWNFSNNDRNLFSPDGLHRIEYTDVHEIAMGSPLAGTCYLMRDLGRTLLHGYAGGPPVWNERGNKVAFPIWAFDRSQQLVVIDVNEMTMTMYAPHFRVLQLEAFEQDIVYGIDSPVFQPEELRFDTRRQIIESVAGL
ncbi:MAG: hypothetical protein QM664_06700 [Flavihumibacter sp.]